MEQQAKFCKTNAAARSFPSEGDARCLLTQSRKYFGGNHTASLDVAKSNGDDFRQGMMAGSKKRDEGAQKKTAYTNNGPVIGTPPCAIHFFGLPRSFRNMALPTILRNIIIPNAKYQCDYFVQFDKPDQDTEDPSRCNRGGNIDTDSVYELVQVVKFVAAAAGVSKSPFIHIAGQPSHVFWEEWGDKVEDYQTAVDPKNSSRPIYVPWKEPGFGPKQIENIVKQWSTLQSLWKIMQSYKKDYYQRVAYFRLDALYLNPIDIFRQADGKMDTANQFAVAPGFAKYPVSDRMMYGPAKAVKIWATQRFDRLDEYIASQAEPGFGMHPERFLAHAIFPAMVQQQQQQGGAVAVVEREDVCFFRLRAGDAALITDCGGRPEEEYYKIGKQVEKLVAPLECKVGKLLMEWDAGVWEARCNTTFIHQESTLDKSSQRLMPPRLDRNQVFVPSEMHILSPPRFEIPSYSLASVVILIFVLVLMRRRRCNQRIKVCATTHSKVPTKST